MAEQAVYVDGRFVPKSEAVVSVFDHGFLYGDGVFEGIRAYNGVVFRLKEHIERLYESAHTIMLEIPLSKDEMEGAVLETLRRNALRDAYIRLIVTRGVGDLGLDPRKCSRASTIIIAGTITLCSREVLEKGIKAQITWVRRDAVDGTSHEVKSLNYLNSILAKLEANNVGADEAIILTPQGYICEGTAENIFIVEEGVIVTPPSYTGALPGITQAAVLELAGRMGIRVDCRPISPHELFNADEAFLTGTAAEIIPVSTVNGRTIGSGRPGPVTMRLRESFSEFVREKANGTPI